MKKALLKDSFKEILKTYKRFISILLMAFLGVGFFAGVRATSPDMKLTVDNYYDNQNMYDISLISTLGLTNEDLQEISNIDSVENAYGIYSEDVFVSFGEEESVVKTYVVQNEINKLEVIEGKLPEKADECVIEKSMQSAENICIGDYIEIKENVKENEEPSFKNNKLKVVGIIKSPRYISRDRGTTTLGSGKVTYYMYMHKDNVISDIFTEIDIIVKNAKVLSTLDENYKELIKNAENDLENIKEKRQNARYNELIEEANAKLNDAQNEFNTEKADAEQKIADAEKEIFDGKEEIKKSEKIILDSKKELENSRQTANTEIANAQNQINDAQNQLIISQEQLDASKSVFETQKVEFQNNIKKLQDAINTYNSGISQLETSKANVQASIDLLNSQIQSKQDEITKLNELKNQMENNGEDSSEISSKIVELENEKALFESQIENAKNNIEALETEIKNYTNDKKVYEQQLNTINTELDKAQNELQAGQNKISTAWQELMNSKSKLEQTKIETEKKFSDAEKEISEGQKKIADSKKEIQNGEKELADKKEEFNTKISEAEEKLIDAREKVNDIEKAKWYIFNRNDNTGFNSYSKDADNVKKLGEAFPIVFFIIATLISLTSMSRMVEEQRVQIGTLKALGYNKWQIMSKYIIYSLLASLLGGILGAIFGLRFFPAVIISMYKMMYNIENIVIEFNKYFAFLGIGIMALCIVGATIYTANKELSSTPAEMMRPKAPKAGKRVLLEKIPFIWNKLNFTQKVTLRNMFRYKKRFFMTVIGIMGCTALIVTGFGLKDSISNIMDYQYVDIYDYDMLINLKNTLTNEEISTLKNDIESKKEIEKCVEVYMTSEDVKNNNISKEAQIIVVNDANNLENVIKLKDIKTGQKLVLNDEEIIITDKLSKLLNVNIGDKVILIDSENKEYEVKIGGIAEHYISHYIYMTQNLYTKLYNKEFSTNVLFAKYSSNILQADEDVLSKEILSNSKVASVTLTSYLMGIMEDTLSSMNLVVYVLIVSAGLLAFVVLYNLSNINISERIRELATIKVLGFYDKEVYDYITREIVLLTIIGIIIGLLFGFVLNSFILGTCEIEMLRFKRIITIQSYVFSALITIIFTCIVNFITFFSLKKVNMIESLKSIE